MVVVVDGGLLLLLLVEEDAATTTTRGCRAQQSTNHYHTFVCKCLQRSVSTTPNQPIMDGAALSGSVLMDLRSCQLSGSYGITRSVISYLGRVRAVARTSSVYIVDDTAINLSIVVKCVIGCARANCHDVAD